MLLLSEFAEFLHAFEKQRDGYADTEDESDTRKPSFIIVVNTPFS